MPQLRVLNSTREPVHKGEVYGCSFSVEGAFVLAAGWDGCLSLWEAGSGQLVSVLRTGGDPLSACAFSPDGKLWLSGSSEGVLVFWDALSHQPYLQVVAHLRPISAIQFSSTGQLATASWDRRVVLRSLSQPGDGHSLTGHTDIVAGMQFGSDGRRLLSWSHDRTLCVWSTKQRRLLATLTGHSDRVTAGALSPDGSWIVSGGRDKRLKVWNARTYQEACSVKLGAEVRVCRIVPDSSAVVSVDAKGFLNLWSLPALDNLGTAMVTVGVLCGDLASSGQQVALGGEDGRVHLVVLEDLPPPALPVVIKSRPAAAGSMLDRLLGAPRTGAVYAYTCPACRRQVELESEPAPAFACLHCGQPLRSTSGRLPPERQPAPTQ
jgi:WD40 repeat protein